MVSRPPPPEKKLERNAHHMALRIFGFARARARGDARAGAHAWVDCSIRKQPICFKVLVE